MLVERGLATSRSQAQRLIAGGVRWRLAGGEWRKAAKNGDEVPQDAEVELLDDAEARYVSRGGLKLEGALAASGVTVDGRDCLDVGQSTGGFTDCLLRHGAARVVGVDVGHGQLNESLRGAARMLCIEGVNARELSAAGLQQAYAAAPEPGAWPVAFDLVVGDLSFISLTLVLPAIVPLVKSGGELLMLVKPQFELQPAQIGKGGIVKDAASHAVVERRIRDCCAGLGLQVQRWFDSPIAGGDGNREFFVLATNQS